MVVFIAFILQACENKVIKDAEFSYENYLDIPKRGWKEIKSDSTITVLFDAKSTSYFLDENQKEYGFDFELLQRFCEDKNLKLIVKVSPDITGIYDSLYSNKADLLAFELTVTKSRTDFLEFTVPTHTTRQVLVQKKPDNWKKMSMLSVEKSLLRDLSDLIGKTIHLRKNSAFITRINHLSEEIGGEIKTKIHKGNIDSEELIQMVSEGKIDYTVADQYTALLAKNNFPNIDVSTPVSLEQNVAWAIRKNAPRLKDTLNDWLSNFKNTKDYKSLYNKYFRSKILKQRGGVSIKNGKISDFDEIIKQYSAEIKWEWTMLASLIFQESNFDPYVVSKANAMGLMQMMPETAARFGVTDIHNPEDNIKAGVKYISYLQKIFKNIPDSLERSKFVLASYNVGPGHIFDARRLAEKYGKNPNIWDDNVAEYLLLKSDPQYYKDEVVKNGYCRGIEPYKFVHEIMDRNIRYKKALGLIKEEVIKTII